MDADRSLTLRHMRICRFCLTENEPLSNIYEKDNKNAIPLPVQIMACITVEVFANDGMPQLICDDCGLQTKKSYSFKTMCKRSDDALKLYLATGTLTKEPKDEVLTSSKPSQKRTIESDSNPDLTAKHIKIDENATKNRPTELVENSAENVELLEHSHTNENDSQKEEAATEELNDNVKENILSDSVKSLNNDENIETNPENNDQKPTQTPKPVITHCFACTQCERTFPLQQLLDIHMRQHLRERKFICYDCDKRFFTKNDILIHMETHKDKKPYTCVVCKKTFARATLLHRHEKVHVSVPKFLCNFCDKTYLTLDDLDIHMQLHKKNKPFKCKVCDKGFAFKQGLERHQVMHKNEKSYKCNYCEESFATPGKLTRHLTMHAGARPFPCKFCARSFVLSHHLTRHLRDHHSKRSVHIENGDYKCDVCSMSFNSIEDLVDHVGIHSMVNLKCVICNKEFLEARFVKDHVKTHLAGLPYGCEKCYYSFETQEELDDHEYKHSSIEEIEEQDEEVDFLLSDDTNKKDSDASDEPLSVRRSLRTAKIKNYAEFLKEELGSDTEENDNGQEEEEEEYGDEDDKEENTKLTGSIQPVIRSETMKMYKGKEKLVSSAKTISEPIVTTTAPVALENETKTVQKTMKKITTLENLGITKQTLDAMTEKSGVVEVKVGQKVIRVKKLMMTKAEYQAMAKHNKLEMKGSTIVVQNKNFDLNKLTQSSGKDTHKVDIDNPDIDVQVSKTPVRTYVKKIIKVKGDTPMEIQTVINRMKQEDHGEQSIDLATNDNDQVDLSLVQDDILRKMID